MAGPTILIMAGGTGGHIMPGLAVARELRDRGWEVIWLGHPDRMEGRLVGQHGFTLEPLIFSGVRGKGIKTLFALPLTLLSAVAQAWRVFGRVKPTVALGMGGYVAFPGGVVAWLRRRPLVIHEQNAVAGTANRWLARLATKVLAGFPGALPGAAVVGNPVRRELAGLSSVSSRYGQRQGRLRLLVIGGSQGAAVLNAVVPEALATLPPQSRPAVRHQSGHKHLAELEAAYARLDVQASTVAFIDDMARALAWADLVVCRAGAMTVAEVAAAGVAALFVPFPHAIDDHQTANAKYLTSCGGAWLCSQDAFTTQWLAEWLQQRDRSQLADVAGHARQQARIGATKAIADACDEVAGAAS